MAKIQFSESHPAKTRDVDLGETGAALEMCKSLIPVRLFCGSSGRLRRSAKGAQTSSSFSNIGHADVHRGFAFLTVGRKRKAPRGCVGRPTPKCKCAAGLLIKGCGMRPCQWSRLRTLSGTAPSEPDSRIGPTSSASCHSPVLEMFYSVMACSRVTHAFLRERERERDGREKQKQKKRELIVPALQTSCLVKPSFDNMYV